MKWLKVPGPSENVIRPAVSKILDIPNVPSLRVSILVLTAFGVALPLGFLRKLSSLTSVSSLSFGFYFSLVLFLFLQVISPCISITSVNR